MFISQMEIHPLHRKARGERKQKYKKKPKSKTYRWATRYGKDFKKYQHHSLRQWGKALLKRYHDEVTSQDFCLHFPGQSDWGVGPIRQMMVSSFKPKQKKHPKKEFQCRRPLPLKEIDYSPYKWKDFLSEVDVIRKLSHLCVIQFYVSGADQKIPKEEVPMRSTFDRHLIYCDPLAPDTLEKDGKVVANPHKMSSNPKRVSGKPCRDGESVMSIKYKSSLLRVNKTLYTIHYHARPRRGTAYIHALPSGSIIVVSAEEKHVLMASDPVMREVDEGLIDPTSVPAFTRGLPRSTRVVKASHDDSEDPTSYQEMKIFQRHMESTFKSSRSWRMTAMRLKKKWL